MSLASPVINRELDSDSHNVSATISSVSRIQLRKYFSEQTGISADVLGMAASSICLVHCMVMPFIVAALPFLGLKFIDGPFTHQILASCVLVFALSAIVPGYLKHRRINIFIPMLIGLMLVIFATFLARFSVGEYWELPLITIGNLILVATHWHNRKLCRCSHAHCNSY